MGITLARLQRRWSAGDRGRRVAVARADLERDLGWRYSLVPPADRGRHLIQAIFDSASLWVVALLWWSMVALGAFTARRRARAVPRAPGAARRADRPAEPRRSSTTGIDAGAAPVAARAGARRRAADRPRPLQGGQRHARPPQRRPAARRNRRPAAARRCARATRSRASAATSSACSCPRAATGRPRPCAAAEKIREALEPTASVDGLPVRGRRQHRHRAVPGARRRTPTTLLQHADVAMYEAKRTPQRRTTIYRAEHDPYNPVPAALVGELRRRDRRAARCCSTTSRRSTSRPARWSASRRWCAGTTRARGLIPPGRVHAGRRAHRADQAAQPLRARARRSRSAREWRDAGLDLHDRGQPVGAQPARPEPAATRCRSC